MLLRVAIMMIQDFPITKIIQKKNLLYHNPFSSANSIRGIVQLKSILSADGRQVVLTREQSFVRVCDRLTDFLMLSSSYNLIIRKLPCSMIEVFCWATEQ